MAKKVIKAQMAQRRDTKANWAAQNPVLLAGELGIVSDDPNLYKVGDGATAWNSLPFRGFDGNIVQETGASTTAVMSQKAVSDNLTNLNVVTYKNQSDLLSEVILDMGYLLTDASEDDNDNTRVRMRGYISAPFAMEVNDGYLIRNVHRYKYGANGEVEHELYAERIAKTFFSTDNTDYIYRVTFTKSDDTLTFSEDELDDIIKSVKGKNDYELNELWESIPRRISTSYLFNHKFSEIYPIGFTEDEIKSVVRVSFSRVAANNDPQIGFNMADGSLLYMACANYGSGIRYFGEMYASEYMGKRGIFVKVEDTEWIDEAFSLSLNPSCMNIQSSPGIMEHLVGLAEIDGNYKVDVSLIIGKRIHKDGYLTAASSSWAATKPIPVKKGDTLHIHTDGNANASVIAKTDADGAFYEHLLSYDSAVRDYKVFIDFDGYIAASLYIGYDAYIHRISSPLANAILNTIVKREENDEGTNVGIASIEQTTTSLEGGGVNVITCTLTDGTKNLFYIRNGKDGKDGSGGNGAATAPNFNSVQLLPRAKEKKPIFEILPSDGWYQTSASDGTLSENPVRIFDEVYNCMTDVMWVDSTSRTKVCYDLPNAIDFGKKVICGSIYLDEDIVDTAKIGETFVKLYSGGVTDSAHQLTIRLQFAGSGNEEFQRTGWFHFCVCPSANAYMTGVSFDITDVRTVAVHVVHDASTSISFGIGRFSIVEGLKRGGVLMLIDNFNPNVPEMAYYIVTTVLKATLSIVPSWIGDNSLHGTLEQIQKCASEGHLIINHTWSHDISNEQTAEDIFNEISLADKWMVRNGFARGSKIVSNPSAAHDLNKYRAYMESEAVMIYHHWTTMGTGDNYTLYYPYKPMSRLLNITALESLGVDYMIAAVNKAVEVGGIAVLGWHGTWYDLENGESDFKKLIDHIASLGNACACYLADEMIEGAYI